MIEQDLLFRSLSGYFDFLFLVPPQEGDGSSTLCLVRSEFATLGVPVAEHKTEGPSAVITFLGIVITVYHCPSHTV